MKNSEMDESTGMALGGNHGDGGVTAQDAPAGTAGAAQDASAGTTGAAGGVPVPMFVLRADKPRHIWALMAVVGTLPEGDAEQARLMLREFELYEEGRRG